MILPQRRGSECLLTNLAHGAGPKRILKCISHPGGFAFSCRKDEYFLMLYTHMLESGEFFQYTPGKPLTLNVSKVGCAGGCHTVCKQNRKRNEDSRCRTNAIRMRLPGTRLYQEVFSSYGLDCTGWAEDLIPVGFKECIRLNRERVAPGPQRMEGAKGITQGDTEEKYLLPPPSEHQPCEILKRPLNSYF